MLKRKLKELSTTSRNIDEIIGILKPYGITGFFYGRYFPNGEFIDLASNPNFAEYYFRKFFSQGYSSDDVTDHLFIGQGISLWTHNPHNVIVQEGKEIFGFSNGINFYENTPDYTELYSFYSASTDQHTMDAFYLRHLEALKNFKNYFLEKADPIIIQAEQNKYLTPEMYLASQAEIVESNHCLNSEINALRIKQRGLEPLSKREHQCLQQLVFGKSALQTAKSLGLSKRTVEHYLANIKSKWHCSKNIELIRIATQLNLN